MSDHKRRIRAIQALVAGSAALASDPAYGAIQTEFGEVYRARKVRSKQRRRLLQILHSTRALDTSLKRFNIYHSCPRGVSLGGYLKALQNHNTASLRRRLSATECRRFQNSIVDQRNRYMHEAGAFPLNDNDAAFLFAEMEDCLAIALNL
ncbi:MAG: hypothetical protein ACREDR_10775 [Blastocatellia bacterium]